MQGGKEMEQFPTDLIVEIFSRLPSKAVARCCTLSKQWLSILRSQDFSKLFLARSSTHPRLLFAVEQYNYNTWQFFSTPQPQNRNEKSSNVDFHSKFSGDISHYKCSYASGLFYFPKVKIVDEHTALVCNPITGLYVRLPQLEKYGEPQGFLGFDPIDKQFKVIKNSGCHSILTLGTEELIWRSIKAVKYEHFLTEGICMNGIFYSLALKIDEEQFLSLVPVIVCFDVRSEEFSLINAEWFSVQPNDPFGLKFDPTVLRLVNYKGKLAGIEWKRADTDGRSTIELCLWVLEDVKKQEWVNYVYTLPDNEVLSSSEISIGGVTATGDILLVMKFVCEPFYAFYFDPERNTLQSVEIQGFGADLVTAEDRGQVYAFVDHVEDSQC